MRFWPREVIWGNNQNVEMQQRQGDFFSCKVANTLHIQELFNDMCSIADDTDTTTTIRFNNVFQRYTSAQNSSRRRIFCVYFRIFEK